MSRHTQITLFMQLLSYAIHHTQLSEGLAPVEESQHLLLHREVGHSALCLQQCQLCGFWLLLDIFNVAFHWSACIKSIFKEKYQTCYLGIKLVLKFLVTIKHFFKSYIPLFCLHKNSEEISNVFFGDKSFAKVFQTITS